MTSAETPPATIAISVGVYMEGMRGIPVFQSYLARHLAEIDARNQYRLFGYFYRDYERKKNLIRVPDRPNFRLDARRWPQGVVDPLILRWDFPLFWPFLKAAGVGLFHSTSLYTPRLPGIKTITTVCDLIPERFPELGVDLGRERVLRWLRRADRLVAISGHTRRDLREIYGIPEERVDVVHLGVDRDVFRPAGADGGAGAEARRRHRLPERYLLTVGPIEVRRNIETLVRVLAELRREPEYRDLALVITGSGGRGAIEGLARSLGVDGAVIMPGYVAVEDMVAFHQGAEAFVYASLYEGFGLSPLEAAACGSPVVSSNAASLPEVLGDCAALVEPRDVGAFARAVLELRRNPELRRRRVEAGLKRAGELTWRRTAERYLGLYEKTLALPAR